MMPVVITLLSIIATSEDTNIVNRSSYEEMKELQARIQTVLKKKPMIPMSFLLMQKNWMLK